MYIFQIKFSSKPVEYNIPNKSCIYANKNKNCDLRNVDFK